MSEEVTWSRKNHSLFESFALDVQDYWRSGKRIDSADKMLRTSFEKQKAAMEQDGLHMSVHMRPNGQLAEKGVSFRRPLRNVRIAVRRIRLEMTIGCRVGAKEVKSLGQG